MQYTLEMGGSPELLEMALRIPPWEPLRPLSSIELSRSGLATQEHNAHAGGEPAPARETVYGWTIAQHAGRLVLTRTHPLTIEGEKIGNFELALSCGARNGVFAVRYTETQQASKDQDATSIANIRLSIDERTIALKTIVPQPTSGKFEIVASGTLPADLVAAFARAPKASIIVRTSSSNRPNTSVRLGNTGLPQQFPQFAATCGIPQVTENALAKRR